MIWLYFIGAFAAFITIITFFAFIFDRGFWTKKKLALLTGLGTITIGLLVGPLMASYFFLLMLAIIVNCTRYTYDKTL